MHRVVSYRFFRIFLALLVGLTITALAPDRVRAQVSPFMQAVAEAASNDRDIAAFYRTNGYKPVWTGQGNPDRQRLAALLTALRKAGDHGLPVVSYDIDGLTASLRQIGSQREMGRLDVELSRTFLKYAQDVQTGVLVPGDIDSGIARKVPRHDRTLMLNDFVASSPTAFLRALPPKAPEYARLMKAKAMLERQMRQGGWGPQVAARALKPGQSGGAVIALRNRMIAMGFLRRSVSQTYDAALQAAVQQFQSANGLASDGVAGPGTMTEINKQIEQRLPNVLVAMERERWMNFPRGKRHVWVNLTDFTAAIVDDDKVTFKTRAVVGKNAHDRRSPEFSDVMEHMIINPTWNVPRSIAIKEYLPQLQANPLAAGHLRLVNARGQTVSRENIDFTQFNSRNFPFDLKQPPSRGNALGLVKFMFPNPYNIYLHDTPAKSLFGRQVRAFSHGCIRLRDPFDFAYALLARQTSDPVGFFRAKLNTGVETKVLLEQPIPVHIVYRTAFTTVKGQLNFRRDVYGRDAKIFAALSGAGVILGGTQS